MWYWISGSWLLLLSIGWLVVYGASLYDRRESTARHRADNVIEGEIVESQGDLILAGE